MLDKISFFSVLPEFLLFVMACVLTLVDLKPQNDKRGLTFGLSVATLLAVLVALLWQADIAEPLVTFNSMVVVDRFAVWLKVFSTIALLVTWVYSNEYLRARDMLKNGGEFFTISLFALLGIFVMISGNHFLSIYLGLELLTLSSYALIAMRRDDAVATEAAMKYFVLGALASGFMLYGFSMLYGATKTLALPQFLAEISSGNYDKHMLLFGVVFVVAGLAFKIGLVPFHMWIPDVYHGAPTAVTLLIGGAPKLAALGIMMRLLVGGMHPLAHDWQQMLLILAVASLVVGNLAAIAQTNLKRMLAFSTIGQMGFVLIGFVAGHGDNAANAYSSSLFYVVSYVLTTLLSFGVILVLSSKESESDTIADFAGLNARKPLFAAAMTIALLSLAGIPPMVGFYAKLSVLQALLASGAPWAMAVALFAVLMSVIATFYYLRVIKVMYFDEPADGASTLNSPTSCFSAILSINGLLVMGLGFFPGGLMAVLTDCVMSLSSVKALIGG